MWVSVSIYTKSAFFLICTVPQDTATLVSSLPMKNRKKKTAARHISDLFAAQAVLVYHGVRSVQFKMVSMLVEVLFYVHRNPKFIRDGSPGCPPRLSHSSRALRYLCTRKSPYTLTPSLRGCWAQNGSTHDRIFATFKRRVFTNRTRNRVINCSVFYIYIFFFFKFC